MNMCARGTQIDLSRNRLGVEGAKVLGPAIAVAGALTSVDVGINGIGKAAALELISIFREKDQMRSVGLGGCDLGVEGARAIADYVRVSGSLTECILRSNGLGVKGWTSIFTALRDSTASKITKWDLPTRAATTRWHHNPDKADRPTHSPSGGS